VKTVFLARFMQRKNARGEPATFLAVPPIWGCAASGGAGFTVFSEKRRTLKGESMSLETYQNMVAELGRACGFSLPVDDTGYTSLEVDGSLICNIQYIEPADAAYIYFEIGRIVAGGEGKVAPELLAGNLFGLGTGGGVLAMEPESRKVMYSYQCGLTELSHERFLDIMDSVMRQAEYWANRLGELNREAVGTGEPAPAEMLFRV
jgi:hypothetical protein